MGFRQIFTKIMDHAIQNEEQKDIHRFIDCLTQIILDLIEHEPKTPDELQQSGEIIEVIASHDVEIYNSAHLNSIKSKLQLIQNIIHMNGLIGFTIDSMKQKQEYPDYPNEFTLLSWSNNEDSRLTTLTNEISHYNRIHHHHYKKRVYSLRKINDLLTEALKNSDYDNEMLALLQVSKSKIPYILKIVISQKMQSEFNFYLISEPQQLEQAKNEYFSQPGHMHKDYYAEMIDPHHRLSAWSKKSWKKSEWKDQPFTTYLGHAAELEEDMRQAIYLDKYQREQVEVVPDISCQLKYKQSGANIEDGYYLYAMDRKHFRMYLHQEYHEEFGKRSFHHSSFLSGKQVICAGGVVIKDNRIVRINNNTGHYLATAEQLLNVVIKLSMNGLLDVENMDLKITVYGVKDAVQPLSFSEFQELCKSIRTYPVEECSAITSSNMIENIDHTHPDEDAIATMINEFIHSVNKDRYVKHKPRAHYFFATKQETNMQDANAETQHTHISKSEVLTIKYR